MTKVIHREKSRAFKTILVRGEQSAAVLTDHLNGDWHIYHEGQSTREFVAYVLYKIQYEVIEEASPEVDESVEIFGYRQ
jgi:hypothetical protein